MWLDNKQETIIIKELSIMANTLKKSNDINNVGGGGIA